MIGKLSEKQIEKFPEYVDKWLKIGLSTEPITLDQARLIVNNVYSRLLGFKSPKQIIILDSPLSIWIGICQLFSRNQVEDQVWHQVRNQVKNQVENQVWNQVGDQVRNQVEDQVRNQVWNQVRNQVWNQVWNQVEDQVRNQVRNQVEDQVRNQVWNQVGDQVRNQVWNQVENQVGNQVEDQVGDQVRNQVRNQVWNQAHNRVWNQVRNQVWNQVGSFVSPYMCGQFDSNYFSFYDYIFNEVLECECNLWSIYRDTSKLSLIYPFEDVCFLSQKPVEINFDANKQLHAEGKPAIKYSDGFSVYALNDVRVPEWLAITRAEDLDPCRIKDLQNAQQRAEFVRKVGRERIASKTIEKVLDDKTIFLNTPIQKNWPCQYRVLELNYGNGVIRYALEMPNPSLPEMWHIEYVPTSVATVEQAMNFRLKRKEEDIDDIEGADFYVQGDRVLVPEGAVKTKRWPALIA